MKKILLSTILCCLSFGVMLAQKDAVKAIKSAVSDKDSNTEEIRAKIQSATTNAETKDDAETWFLAGSFEDKIFNNENIKVIAKQQPDEALMYDALFRSYDYFNETMRLEKIPNEKGKTSNKYTKQIKPILKANQPYYTNSGIYYYNNGDYSAAYKAFKTFLDIKNLDIFAQETLYPDSVYNQIKSLAGQAATNAEDYPNAIKMFSELTSTDYEQEETYRYLAINYQAINDSAKYVETVKEGVRKFPDNRFFLESVINVYIRNGQMEEALKYLDEAIESNPGVPEYWRVKGDLYETEFKDEEKALEAFQKALELDPDFTPAIYAIGRLYYNQALKAQQEANEKDLASAQKDKEKIDDLYRKALPYLEKAHKMSPDDKQYINALYVTYYALKMPEAAEMEKLLSE